MIFARKTALSAIAAAVWFGIFFTVGCGTTYRPIAIPIIQPGGDSQQSATVAVINRNPSASTAGSATFINVSGDTNTGNASAGLGVARASYDSSHFALYVPNPGSNNVTYLLQLGGSTTITNTSLSVTAGSSPTSIFPGSGVMYALNSGPNSDCPAGPSVGVIDTGTSTLSTNICVGKSPVWAVTAGSQSLLFVVDSVENAVYVIDTIKNVVKTVLPVGANPVWIQLGGVRGTYAFVLNQGDNSVSIIDVVNAKALGSVPLPAGDTKPVSGYVPSTGTRLYVSNQGSETLSALNIKEDPSNAANPVTLAIAAPSLKTGKIPTTVTGSGDNSLVFVANTGDGTVTQFSSDPLPSDTSKCPDPINPSKCVLKVYPITSRTTSAAVTITDIGTGADTLNGKCSYKLYVSSVTADNLDNGTTIICTSTGLPVNDLGDGKFTPAVSAPCDLYVATNDLKVADGGAGGTLAAGTYWYRVTAVDSAGGESSIYGPDPANNSVPAIELSIANPGGHTDQVSWTRVKDASGYNIYRGTAKGGEVLLAPGVSAPPFVDDGSLIPGAQVPPVSCTRQRPIQVAGSR